MQLAPVHLHTDKREALQRHGHLQHAGRDSSVTLLLDLAKCFEKVFHHRRVVKAHKHGSPLHALRMSFAIGSSEPSA